MSRWIEGDGRLDLWGAMLNVVGLLLWLVMTSLCGLRLRPRRLWRLKGQLPPQIHFFLVQDLKFLFCSHQLFLHHRHGLLVKQILRLKQGERKNTLLRTYIRIFCVVFSEERKKKFFLHVKIRRDDDFHFMAKEKANLRIVLTRRSVGRD